MKWNATPGQILDVFIKRYPITSDGKKVRALFIQTAAAPPDSATQTRTRWAAANSPLTKTTDLYPPPNSLCRYPLKNSSSGRAIKKNCVSKKAPVSPAPPISLRIRLLSVNLEYTNRNRT